MASRGGAVFGDQRTAGSSADRATRTAPRGTPANHGFTISASQTGAIGLGVANEKSTRKAVAFVFVDDGVAKNRLDGPIYLGVSS